MRVDQKELRFATADLSITLPRGVEILGAEQAEPRGLILIYQGANVPPPDEAADKRLLVPRVFHLRETGEEVLASWIYIRSFVSRSFLTSYEPKLFHLYAEPERKQ